MNIAELWNTLAPDEDHRCRNYRLGLDIPDRPGGQGRNVTPGETRILESLHELHRKVDSMSPITQAQFDGDLAPFFTKITDYITASQGAILARDATIADLQAQVVTLQGEVGNPPPAPDFTTEDTQVTNASAALDTALQTIPTAPGAVPPPSLATPVVPQFVKDAQAANAAKAPEQST